MGIEDELYWVIDVIVPNNDEVAIRLEDVCYAERLSSRICWEDTTSVAAKNGADALVTSRSFHMTC